MMIHEALAVLLPKHQEVIIEGASHPMFATHRTESEEAVRDFFARRPAED